MLDASQELYLTNPYGNASAPILMLKQGATAFSAHASPLAVAPQLFSSPSGICGNPETGVLYVTNGQLTYGTPPVVAIHLDSLHVHPLVQRCA